MAAPPEPFFKPEAKTVREIFDGGNYYQVPDYQRAYSWTDEEIEELWNDLYSAFEEGEPSYFLGPVILTAPKDGRSGIIDGQQRLTTLTILFCVLRDLYAPEDPRVLNRVKSLEEGKWRLRLITQLDQQNHFEQSVLKEVKIPLGKPPEDGDKFLNAAWIFREKLSHLEKPTIDNFLSYILTKVVLIVITCSDLASAIKLFRVINTRGLDLSNADLIKSYLYSRLGDELERNKFRATWTQIEQLAQQMGPETIENLFTFYEYYLLARVPKRSLYEEIEDQFKSDDPNAAVYKFKTFVEGYNEVYSIQSKAVFSLFYLHNQVFWKSILASAKMTGYSDTEFAELSVLLRALYYAYWIAGHTAAKLRQFSFDIIAALKNKRSIPDLKNLVTEKMNRDRIAELVSGNLLDNAYEARWLKPALVSIEYEQTDNSKVGFIDLDRNLQVDHILPQAWKQDSTWRARWTEDDAKEWLQRPGNLALLSGKKNAQASNDSFDKKKRIYDGKGIDGKTAFLTSQTISMNEDWLVNQARERQAWFTKEIGKITQVQ